MFEWLNGYKTFIGIAISAIFKILAMKGIINPASSEDVNHTVEIIYAAISLVGDAIATFGRLKASKPGALVTK